MLTGHPRMRVIRMTRTPPGRGNGQSAAFHAGFRAARGERIASLDADLQNDPGDLVAMLKTMDETGADMVQGDRTRARQDTPWRRFSSWGRADVQTHGARGTRFATPVARCAS